MLFQKLHTIRENFENQTQQHVFGYTKSLDIILFRRRLFGELNKELLEEENSFEFLSTQDEIRYYKHEKPMFQKYGIYYHSLSNIELFVPMGSPKTKNEYYEKELDKINQTFNESHDHIIYYRMKSTDDDENLFVRNSPNNHIFALIEATSLMEEFLYNVNDPRTIDEKINDFPSLEWTGKLSELVVLLKALVISGRINHGKATAVDVVRYAQVMFKVDLKDFYRKYQDVKNSQNPTKFLDYLSELIIEDINQHDEKAIIRKKK